MEELEYITIDNINYVIIDEIIINNVKYVYMAREDDISKILIKKVNIINGEECLVSLNSEEEFNKALISYREKNKDLGK